MFDPLSFWRNKPVADAVVSGNVFLSGPPAVVELRPTAIDPTTLKVIVDEVFNVLEAATTSRPIIHGALLGLHAIADLLIPRIAGNLAARGVKV